MEVATSDRVRSHRFTFESEILIEAAHRGHLTFAVAIPGRYPDGARCSHYRSVVDTVKIVDMVARRLLRKCLYPRGLWRSLQRAQLPSMASSTALDRGR